MSTAEQEVQPSALNKNQRRSRNRRMRQKREILNSQSSGGDGDDLGSASSQKLGSSCDGDDLGSAGPQKHGSNSGGEARPLTKNQSRRRNRRLAKREEQLAKPTVSMKCDEILERLTNKAADVGSLPFQFIDVVEMCSLAHTSKKIYDCVKAALASSDLRTPKCDRTEKHERDRWFIAVTQYNTNVRSFWEQPANSADSADDGGNVPVPKPVEFRINTFARIPGSDVYVVRQRIRSLSFTNITSLRVSSLDLVDFANERLSQLPKLQTLTIRSSTVELYRTKAQKFDTDQWAAVSIVLETNPYTIFTHCDELAREEHKSGCVLPTATLRWNVKAPFTVFNHPSDPFNSNAKLVPDSFANNMRRLEIVVRDVEHSYMRQSFTEFKEDYGSQKLFEVAGGLHTHCLFEELVRLKDALETKFPHCKVTETLLPNRYILAFDMQQ